MYNYVTIIWFYETNKNGCFFVDFFFAIFLLGR